MSGQLRKTFWEEGIIGIHYDDIESIVPSDHRDTQVAEAAFTVLNEIAQDGGFVCATVHPYPGCMIGRVSRGSTIGYMQEPYNDKGLGLLLMKTIPLRDVIRPNPLDANRLLIGQPRQGTLCRWNAPRLRVQRYVEDGRIVIRGVDDLLPYEQEIMCSEYLRTPTAKLHNLPTLAMLRAPVGRNRATVDIDAITNDGLPLLAQVTYHHRTSAEVEEKARRLKELVSTNECPNPVMFCNCDAETAENGIRYFPLNYVFNEMKDVPVWKRVIGMTGPAWQ